MRGFRFGVVVIFLSLAGAACAHGGSPPGKSAISGASVDEAAASASAQVSTRELGYDAGGTHLKGMLAYPAHAGGPRPGVLVLPEWWGLNDHGRERARALAELGYVALAADLFGEGKNTEHAADAQKMMMELMSNQEVAAQRFEAALATLKADPHVDPNKIAAIGFCMGGAVALAAARRGDDLDLVGVFHGNYATQTPMPKGAFAGKIFIAHGAADSFNPPDKVQALKQELDGAGARYEIVSYAGAKHGFTNPAATELGIKNGLDLAYDAQADAQSWAKLQELLQEAFPES
ncbi:MAG TPA: dienelactone hydrolase family protein [Polyangiaceae bacterium]|nr:dienelactone hydrolase family protein [Polyangiaceae bacterium]